MPNASVIVTSPLNMMEAAFRLGVPTFLLVAGMLFLGPKFDRLAESSQHVDAELQVVIQRCGYVAPSAVGP